MRPLMVVFGLLLPLSIVSQVQTLAGDARLHELAGQYDGLSRAFASHDVETILNYRTADFSAVFPNGDRHDGQQMEQVLRHFFVQNRPPYDVRYTIRCAAFAGTDDAVLIIFQQASRTQEVAGAWRRVQSDITQRERWRRTAAGWRLRQIDAIQDPHRWVDGVQVEPGKPYDPSRPPYVPPPARKRTCAELLASPTSAAQKAVAGQRG